MQGGVHGGVHTAVCTGFVTGRKWRNSSVYGKRGSFQALEGVRRRWKGAGKALEGRWKVAGKRWKALRGAGRRWKQALEAGAGRRKALEEGAGRRQALEEGAGKTKKREEVANFLLSISAGRRLGGAGKTKAAKWRHFLPSIREILLTVHGTRYTVKESFPYLPPA